MLIQRICLSLFLFFPTLMAQAQDEWQYSEVVRPDVPVVGLQDLSLIHI